LRVASVLRFMVVLTNIEQVEAETLITIVSETQSRTLTLLYDPDLVQRKQNQNSLITLAC
jgi:hypothetical protein